MRSIRTALHIALAILAVACSVGAQGETPAPRPGEPAVVPPAPAPAFETITRTLADKVVMTADLFRVPTTDEKAPPKPVLVCFHMTRSSRGEYRTLAPQFVERGFNVLAVDLRCGGAGEKGDRRTGERSGTMNETWKSAKTVLGHDPIYTEAYPDIGAAVDWAHELFPNSRIGIVGSSYSASFVLVYAAEHPTKVDAVVSMSPGEYMLPDFVIADKVRKLVVPTYITCGNTPADSNQAKPVAQAIQNRKRLITFWPEDHGVIGDHGSRTLNVKVEASQKKQWEMLDKALEPLKQPPVRPTPGK